MSSNYRKIEFETQRAYGSTEKKFLYIHYHNTCDHVWVYDQDGDLLFLFDEWGDFDMGKAIVIALTRFKNEKLQICPHDEWEKDN